MARVRFSKHYIRVSQPPPLEKVTISSLPFELLETIFMFYLSGTPTARSAPPSSPSIALIFPHPSPLNLLKVSQRWREVAFSNAHLWTCVYLPNRIRSAFKVLRMHILHSAEQPLSITLVTDTYDPVWGLVVACSHRWKNIDFACSGPPPFLFHQLASLPLLQSVSLTTFNLTFAMLSTTTHECPSLREIDYRNAPYYHLLIPAPPWAQLTRVGLPMLDDIQLLTILIECTNIESVSVNGLLCNPMSTLTDHFQNYTSLSKGILNLPKLAELSLYIRTGSDPAGLFDVLVLPSLTTVCLTYDSRNLTLASPHSQATSQYDDNFTFTMATSLPPSQVGISAFLFLLRRSRCSILEFTFHTPGWHPLSPGLLECFNAPEMQKCRKLEVDGYLSESHMRALTKGRGRQAMMPLLTDITLHCGPACHNLISDMVRTRMRGVGGWNSPLNGRKREWVKMKLMMEPTTFERENDALKAMFDSEKSAIKLKLFILKVAVVTPITFSWDL